MKEIQKKDDKGLVSHVQEKREEIRSFRFGTGSRNVRSVRAAKKEIARSLFELSTRKRNASNKSA